MPDIALGVKVFTRTGKLSELIDSIDPDIIDVVYIADDGEIDSKKDDLYSKKYPFELNVLDLEYDAGLGYGRKRIVDQCTEDYLLIVDSDHTIPQNVDILYQQLEEDKTLGGVSGALIENDRIYDGARDLFNKGDILVQDIKKNKRVRKLAGAPLINFDYLPNAAMFRLSCLNDYNWDENYVIGFEHEDFYLGHKEYTNWKFGLCPIVLFNHNPESSRSYLGHRENTDKLTRSQEYFCDKWGYDDILKVRTTWMDSYRGKSTTISIMAQSFRRFIANFAPSIVQKTVIDINNRFSNRT